MQSWAEFFDEVTQAQLQCGRSNAAIEVIPISKRQAPGQIEAALAQKSFPQKLGENYLFELESKKKLFATKHLPIEWHFVGALQSRKIARIAQVADVLHAVCREIELKMLAEQEHIPLFYIEVNVSGEASKHGFSTGELGRTLEQLKAFDRLDVNGLMTMAPLFDRAEMTRPIFATLAELAGRFGLKELSMGMSNDFEIAIEEGATQIRVGSALFE